MKRSQINLEIDHAKALFDAIGFRLPGFAFWTIDDWQKNHHLAEEIIENQLGWDVTDYGKEEFHKTGLLLFTIRNGNAKKNARFPKPYAEKIMVIKQGQVAPMHFHWKKTEDIINRGGGNLVLVIYGSSPDEDFSGRPVRISVDGLLRTVQPGDKVVLMPGESICLRPGVYHKFYAEEGKGDVVIGEVSQVNDDENDNRFYESIGRFPDIEEDVRPNHLLCFEYQKWIDPDCD